MVGGLSVGKFAKTLGRRNSLLLNNKGKKLIDVEFLLGIEPRVQHRLRLIDGDNANFTEQNIEFVFDLIVFGHCVGDFFFE